MIVNMYDSKLSMNWKEDTMMLYVLWLMMPLLERCLPKEKYAVYERWLRRKKIQVYTERETNKYLQEYYDQDRIPIFSSVEIEAINRCNGECPFCPVNKYSDPRQMKKMSESLFKKIIDELGEMRYSGKLALHSNNEPFLDSRIIEFARYAHEHVPNAFVYLYTNGTLLTLDNFKAIIPFLDGIVIDNYDDELKLHNNIKEIHLFCKKNKDVDKKVQIRLRKVHEVLDTRGGQSPNNTKEKAMRMSCVLPYKQMVIRPDGKVSLCCSDPYGKNTLADLNKMTIKEAWYSMRYKEVRQALRKGRNRIRLCKYCDTMPDPNLF